MIASTTLGRAPAIMVQLNVDLAALAKLCEERFEDRQRRILADPTMDPRLKTIYLNRALVTTSEAMTLMGFKGTHRISFMRGNAKLPGHRRPHPSVYPDADAILRIPGSGHDDQCVERGRLEEFLVQSMRRVFNARTGTTQLATILMRTGAGRKDPAARNVPRKRQAAKANRPEQKHG